MMPAPSLLPTLIHTERLTLRQWNTDDVDALATAITSSLDELLPWMPWARFEPVERPDRLGLIEQWRTEQAHGGSSVLGVFRNGVIVGATGLHNRIGPTALEIGYWLVSSHTGKGYATELAAALTTAAFQMENVESVEIRCDKANARSEAIPIRLGYELLEEVAEEVTAPGQVGIEHRYRIARCDWDPDFVAPA